MWSPCVQVAHQILEQVFQRSRASSSSSAEQPQLTGSSPGVHLEPSGKLVQARWARRQEEGGHRLRLQDLPSLGGRWGWHYAGEALTQETMEVCIKTKKKKKWPEKVRHMVYCSEDNATLSRFYSHMACNRRRFKLLIKRKQKGEWGVGLNVKHEKCEFQYKETTTHQLFLGIRIKSLQN